MSDHSEHQFKTEGSPVACIQCPVGQRLMKGGTSSSSCDGCDLNTAKFVDSNGYCDTCLSQCSKCNDKIGCTSCQDPALNVQHDGSCSNGCPVNFKADSNKVCKALSCNIDGCSECSDDNVCSKCEAGNNLQTGGSCSAGCPVNHKADQNGVCQSLSCSPINCKECSDNEICAVCESGYKLDSNQCSLLTPAPSSSLPEQPSGSGSQKLVEVKYVIIQVYEPTIISDFIF